MKYPIPDDWDGETLRCIQIQWPDSTLWDAVLHGMLSALFRGRNWDEKSGSVLSVIETGKMLWELNKELTSCDGTPCPEIPPEIIEIYTGAGCVESEDEMPCIAIDQLLKFEGGKWWGRNSCCEWVLIPGQEDGDAGTIDPPYENQDPEPAYSACGKAAAIVEVIYECVDRIWETYDDPPYKWVGDIEDTFPGSYDLDDNNIIGSYLLIGSYASAGKTESDLVQTDQKQRLICTVVKKLTDDSSGVTRAQYDSILGALDGIYGLVEAQIFKNVFEIFGPGDLSNTAMLMATDTTTDCDCPAEGIQDPTPGWSTTWSHFWDFTKGEHGFAAMGGTDTVYVSGLGWVDWALQVNGYAFTKIWRALDTEAGSVTRIWLKVRVGTGLDYNDTGLEMKVDDATFRTGGSPGGDPVASGGEIIYDYPLASPVALGVNSNSLYASIKGYIPTPVSGETDSRSPVIMAIAIGGTGTDPFVN